MQMRYVLALTLMSAARATEPDAREERGERRREITESTSWKIRKTAPLLAQVRERSCLKVSPTEKPVSAVYSTVHVCGAGAHRSTDFFRMKLHRLYVNPS